jgi:hypothetical protein
MPAISLGSRITRECCRTRRWINRSNKISVENAYPHLVLLSQKVAFCELGIVDRFGRFVFRHEELRWITQ